MTKTIATIPIKERVKDTQSFKSLSVIGQRLFLKRNNLASIEHALTVIENIGFEDWERISNYTYRNILVIKDLLKNG
jgi:hypothetical protein